MKPVKMYTTAFCMFCFQAKRLLKSKGVSFQEIDVSMDRETRRQVAEETGHRTVPMIFIGDEFIGGSSELHALEASGQLDEMLAG